METTRIEGNGRSGRHAERKDDKGREAIEDHEMGVESCPNCHAAIPTDAPMGLCPLCLLGANASDSSGIAASGEALPIGSLVGSHQIRRLIATSMGQVYEARDLRIGRDVALKMLIEGELANEIAVHLFIEEIKAFGKLDHPNIVPAYEAGEHEGRHYFTMKLMKGGSLRKDMKRYRADPRSAAELIEKVARAVRHLHQRGILHRDLKPANILLDENGEPHVADFGVAKHAGEEGQFAGTGTVAGTLPYMAPEQHLPADPGGGPMKSPTWASDVYSLGVILYELITGKKPFRGETEQEIAHAKGKPPIDPRAMNPRIDRDLARICLKSIERDPERRYVSAHALAQALRRYLNDEAHEEAARIERAWRWCLRHAVTTGLIFAGLLFLLMMMPSAMSLIHGQEAAKRAHIRQVNMNSATMVAGTVLAQLRALSDAVERAASNENLARALESGDADALQAFCESTYSGYENVFRNLKLDGNSPFDMWNVLDVNGIRRARFPPPGSANNDYEWRDYFKGAWELGQRGLHSTYISRAFQSEVDRYYKFGISAPIYGRNRRPVGVIFAGVPAASYLGTLVVHDKESVTALAAPRDQERAVSPASSHLILLHPDYAYGEALPTMDKTIRQLDDASRIDDQRIDRSLGLPPPDLVMSSDAYEDPAAIEYPQYAGRWLAGFAPVGNTGFVVIVQTREDKTWDSEIQLGKKLGTTAGISAIPGLLLVPLAAWYRRRRRARLVPQRAFG